MAACGSVLTNKYAEGKPYKRFYNGCGNIDVIEVDTIEDLIDAHSEVRQPINFYEDKENKKGYFVLTNGNLAWKYVLRARKKRR